MKYPLFTIFDHKAGRYSAPNPDLNEQVAVRGFAQAVNNNESFRFAPGDYDLFKVGEFDQDSGRIDVSDPIEFIVNGSSLVGE